ncbi:MAG: Gamma-butyrobetaine hydroxylase-like, N-terminal, partial [Geminicoccaceae bacterium]|nr:Gamma-butyrobetaine hydroxylase-like, N-terminal [Geminicoccaceae bacterium]
MSGAALEMPEAAPPRPAGGDRERARPVVEMAEPAAFASERRIVAAENGERQIGVTWDDGTVQGLHPLWLRSECACPECRDRVTLERSFDQFRLPPD